ncbi:MAG: PQQ-binding-like beta-propeller repeat protein [Bacteroidales bacterium]
MINKRKKYNRDTRYFLIPAVLVLLLASCKGGLPSSDKGSMDWNVFRGSSALNGYTDLPLPEEPKLLWAYKEAVRTSSSPMVYKGTTYWCDKKGKIYGVDIKGTLVFEYDLKTAVESSPLIYDSTLFIGRIDGFMTAISLKTKNIVWEYETMGEIHSPPNLMNFSGRDAIVFGSYDNFLYCLDVKNGSKLSSFESGYYLNGAAALWDNHVIFGGCDQWLRIIDCKTGMQTDSLLLDAYIPSSPAIMGDYCYVGDYSGNIYELMLENGKITRHKKVVEGNDNGSVQSVPAISCATCYFFHNNRYVHATNRKDGKLLWKYMLKGNVGESSPLVCKDKIIVCTKTGIVSILSATNGTLLWEYDTGEQIVGSPAVIKDHFMVLSAKGTLLCFGNEK